MPQCPVAGDANDLRNGGNYDDDMQVSRSTHGLLQLAASAHRSRIRYLSKKNSRILTNFPK